MTFRLITTILDLEDVVRVMGVVLIGVIDTVLTIMLLFVMASEVFRCDREVMSTHTIPRTYTHMLHWTSKGWFIGEHMDSEVCKPRQKSLW
ncbi:MAG: hypothetical protein ACE5H4_00755 [Candidatus Thorarchaeota archaeon]